MANNNTGCSNICFDCINACGGCPWTELDPKTNRPKFAPVPGWEAKKVVRFECREVTETYHITACPLFERDEQRKVPQVGELSLDELRVLLAHWKRLGV